MTTKKREALAQSSVVSALKDMPCRLCSVLARRLQALLMPAHSPLRSAPSPTLCAQSHSAYTECSRSFPSCSQLHRSTLSCCTTTAAWHRPTQGRCTRRCIITCFQGPPRGGAQILPQIRFACSSTTPLIGESACMVCLQRTCLWIFHMLWRSSAKCADYSLEKFAHFLGLLACVSVVFNFAVTRWDQFCSSHLLCLLAEASKKSNNSLRTILGLPLLPCNSCFRLLVGIVRAVDRFTV